MAIFNVKVGNLTVPMDLESEHDVRRNIQYIGKVLGLPPSSLIPQMAGVAPPGVGLKYDVKEVSAGSPFPGGTSLRQNAIQAHLPQAGEVQPENPGDSFEIPTARTIELFDPNDPTLQPPYPANRFPDQQVTPPDVPVKNI